MFTLKHSKVRQSKAKEDKIYWTLTGKLAKALKQDKPSHVNPSQALFEFARCLEPQTHLTVITPAVK